MPYTIYYIPSKINAYEETEPAHSRGCFYIPTDRKGIRHKTENIERV